MLFLPTVQLIVLWSLRVLASKPKSEWSDSYPPWTSSPTQTTPCHKHSPSPTYNPGQISSRSPQSNIFRTNSPINNELTQIPSTYPTFIPNNPSTTPTFNPVTTYSPTEITTYSPTASSTSAPTNNPTYVPTIVPTFILETKDPTDTPTYVPTLFPTFFPTPQINNQVTSIPVNIPPTIQPSSSLPPTTLIQTTNKPAVTSTPNFPTNFPTKAHSSTIYPSLSTSSPTEILSGCSTNQFKGDGWCDLVLNTESCSYDSGDCCIETCSLGSLFQCGIIFYDCRDPLFNNSYFTFTKEQNLQFAVGNVSKFDESSELWNALVYISINSILEKFRGSYTWKIRHLERRRLTLREVSFRQEVNIVILVTQFKDISKDLNISEVLQNSIDQGFLQRAIRKFAEDIGVPQFQFVVICSGSNVSCGFSTDKQEINGESNDNTNNLSTIFIFCGSIFGCVLFSGVVIVGRRRLLKKKKSKGFEHEEEDAVSELTSSQEEVHNNQMRFPFSDRIFRESSSERYKPDWINKWNDPQSIQRKSEDMELARRSQWMDNLSDLASNDVGSEVTAEIWTSRK